MATFQISRIQIRRGKANEGTGVPQLASGELAWAVDTQELFVGNGSISEGAPAVGNTKILTAKDIAATGGILNALKYTYKKNDNTVITGLTSSLPVYRPIQDRLDDYVNLLDFVTDADRQTGEYTAALQRAIDQLFLNPVTKASETGIDATARRVTLFIPAGIYNISSTLLIPSYASIVGAGIDKTVINYTATSAAVRLVNDSSIIGYPDQTVTSGSTRPRYINLNNLSITTASTSSAVLFNSATDCNFANLKLSGVWGVSSSDLAHGIEMSAVSSVVTCENNIFSNIQFFGFYNCIFSNYDIKHNQFKNCSFNFSRNGVVLGQTLSGNLGQQYGPEDTVIDDCTFTGIYQNAMFVGTGNNNRLVNPVLINVGNGSIGTLESPTTVTYPQVYFGTSTNGIEIPNSYREFELSKQVALPFVPCVAGIGIKYSSFAEHQASLTVDNVVTGVFRLPVNTNSSGTPTNSVSCKVQYNCVSDLGNYSRSGELSITADISASILAGSSVINASDDYVVSGNGTNATAVTFTADLVDAAGVPFTGTAGQVPSAIQIYYLKTTLSDVVSMSYCYTIST